MVTLKLINRFSQNWAASTAFLCVELLLGYNEGFSKASKLLKFSDQSFCQTNFGGDSQQE